MLKISTCTFLEHEVHDLSATITLEERKAKVLMKLRGYKLLKREEKKDSIDFIVKMPRKKQKALLRCIPTTGTVGVAYSNQLGKAMKEAELENGIIIASGRYTQAAKKKAVVLGIELIPRIFQAFTIFKHKLVPIHEILTPEEREQLLAKYRIQPYQLPRIRASDPAVTAIGATPGNIVRIIRESPTAGKYTGYRYVVED